MLYAGEILGDRYKIVKEIGRGGMSIVYQADDLRLGSGKLWAVKEFTYSNPQADTERREAEKNSLREEAEIMKKLDHPTLPRIVDIIEKDETLYIVMDFIEGVSLDKVVGKKGALEQDAVIEWGKQLSAALDYLHTQNPPIIYRDMKPANIMLKPDGTVRLIDFGIAQEFKEGTSGEPSFGTRGYAAPEQEEDDGCVDARSDIYSLGVTLHHLVTGKSPIDPPYTIDPIRSYNNKLSSALEWVIQKCTQMEPQARFQSCAELYYVLDNLERFDWEYVRKLKRKRNVFLLSSVFAVLFALLGVLSIQLKTTEIEQQYTQYMGWDTLEGYEAALDLKQTPEAYRKLVEKLRTSHLEGIYASSDAEGYDGSAGQVLDSTLSLGYFSTDALSALKEEDTEAYIRVNYELGLLYWGSYKGSVPKEAASLATKYFQNVLMAVNELDDNGGLNSTEYAITKNYYVTGYLQSWNMKSADDGRIEVDTALKLAMGLSSEDSVDITGLYTIYWQSLQGVLDSVKGTGGISDDAKLNTLYRLLYMFNDRCSDFYGRLDAEGNEIVSAEAAKQFYLDISSEMKSLEAAGAELEDVSAEDLLLAAARTIEATFDVDIDV